MYALINLVFTDILLKTEQDIIRDISEEFENNYQILNVIDISVELDTDNRRIFVSIEWEMKDFPVITGIYNRYWSS